MKLIFNLRCLLYGHILNPLWYSKAKRRKLRGQIIAAEVEKYLCKILPDLDFTYHQPVAPHTSERIFSIWFQGVDQAPDLVKSCWESMRQQTGLEVVVLDDTTLWDWITLPDYIMDQWKQGKIRPAHFSDICRVELLWKYGGYWMDATCFIPHPLPQYVAESPFFIYMAGQKGAGWYAFVQNCFIHSSAGNPLIGAWCQAMHEYWRIEEKAIDYFINQMLFHHAIIHCPQAARLFGQMPKVVQEPTHTVWFEGYADKPFDREEFQRQTSSVAFQKTAYRSSCASNPVPGSYADYIVNWFRNR